MREDAGVMSMGILYALAYLVLCVPSAMIWGMCRGPSYNEITNMDLFAIFGIPLMVIAAWVIIWWASMFYYYKVLDEEDDPEN